jgi:uncharacterized protein (TIGR03083 family)
VDLIDLHRQAAATTGAIIDRVPGDLLDAPTPCAHWAVRDVIAHLVDNHRGLVARAGRSEIDSGGFAATARVFNETFADPAVQDAPFELAGIPIDGRGVIAVQFADVLVHGWDIGRSAGLDVSIPDDLATAAMRITSGFPENLRGPDGAFDHARTTPADAPAGVRLLAFLGRDPEWTGPRPARSNSPN